MATLHIKGVKTTPTLPNKTLGDVLAEYAEAPSAVKFTNVAGEDVIARISEDEEGDLVCLDMQNLGHGAEDPDEVQVVPASVIPLHVAEIAVPLALAPKLEAAVAELMAKI